VPTGFVTLCRFGSFSLCQGSPLKRLTRRAIIEGTLNWTMCKRAEESDDHDDDVAVQRALLLSELDCRPPRESVDPAIPRLGPLGIAIEARTAASILESALPPLQQARDRSDMRREISMDKELDITVADQIAVLTLSQAMSLDSAGKRAIGDAAKELGQRGDVRVLIVTSSHPAAFLVNVSELADMEEAAAVAYSRAGHLLANTLESLPSPVIAAVEGAAVGGGCELVLACDIAIAGAEATFGQIEALGGAMPGFGGTWRLVRRVGFQRACEMMYTGSILDAATAKAYGLVLEVSRTRGSFAAAKELAERICKTRPASIAAIKRVAHAAWNLGPSQADELEEDAFPKLFGEEQSARMHAFLKRQAPMND
jgi:enoyl-CoA hydratase/carnithine racemase